MGLLSVHREGLCQTSVFRTAVFVILSLSVAQSCYFMLKSIFLYHGCHNLKVWVIVEVVMPFLTLFQLTFTKVTHFPICGKDVRIRSDSPPIDVLYRPLWISDLTGFLLLLIANLLYKQMILMHVMVLKNAFRKLWLLCVGTLSKLLHRMSVYRHVWISVYVSIPWNKYGAYYFGCLQIVS